MRDRILGLEHIPVSSLVPHPKNWRKHPLQQRNALRGVLDEIGFARAVIARKLDDGTYQILDGHLRAESLPGETLPVLVVDLNDEEARRFLVSADPLAAMAEADTDRVRALLESVSTANADLDRLLAGVASSAGVDLSDDKMAPIPPPELPVAPRGRATPAGDAPPGPGSDDDDDPGDEDPTGPEHVRMVQLLFRDEAAYALFLGCVESISARLGLNNVTDAVFSAVSMTAAARVPVSA